MTATLKSSAQKVAYRKLASPRVSGVDHLDQRQESSSDKVFRGIVRGLYDGRYVPGQRLVEADLTRDFKVSRSSVREALNRLRAEGIVTLNLHRGAQIRSLTREEAFEIMDLLEVLVGLAARLAARRIDQPGHRVLLESCLTTLSDHMRRSEFFEFVRARNDFYRTLLRIAGSGELKRLLTSVHVNLIRIQSRALEVQYGREKMRMEDYRVIAAAVLAGDARRAETAARRHVNNVRKLLGSLPQQIYPSEAD